MLFVWILVGILAVGGTFVGVYNASEDTWHALNLAGIVSAVFVLTVVIFSTRKPFPPRKRMKVLLLVVIGIFLVWNSWSGNDSRSHFQAETIMKIRRVITEGVFHHDLKARGIRSLYEYYVGKKRTGESLDDVFRRLYPPKYSDPTVVDSLFEREWVYLSTPNDTSVVLVALSEFVRGENPEFRNHDGRVGMMQSRLTITERGIRYDIEN